MSRTAKTFAYSLNPEFASALVEAATAKGVTASALTAEVVENFLLEGGFVEPAAAADLLLLRALRDDAIDKLHHLVSTEGFSADITRRTFQACQDDAAWLANYRTYVRDDPYRTGNPRKTNANQTIGSRIKSELQAVDVIDEFGKPARGRAPVGMIIQTYQMLQMP